MDGFLCIYILNLIELFFVDFPSMKCSPLPVHLFRLRLRLVFGSGQQKVDRCNNDDVTSARMGRQSGFHLVQSAYWKRFKDVCTDGFVLSSWLTCECTFLFYTEPLSLCIQTQRIFETQTTWYSSGRDT